MLNWAGKKNMPLDCKWIWRNWLWGERGKTLTKRDGDVETQRKRASVHLFLKQWRRSHTKTASLCHFRPLGCVTIVYSVDNTNTGKRVKSEDRVVVEDAPLGAVAYDELCCCQITKTWSAAADWQGHRVWWPKRLSRAQLEVPGKAPVTTGCIDKCHSCKGKGWSVEGRKR